MEKSPGIIKRAFLYFSIFAIALLTTTCAFTKMDITILFRDTGDLKKGSPVLLDTTEIGKVTDIKPQDGKAAVKVQISGEYKDRIKEKSAFYVLESGDETHIEVQVLDENSPPLKPDTTVNGSPEYMYWMMKGAEEVKGWIEKGIEKTEEFFKSDEWKEFKDKMEEEIDRAKKEGEEELKKQLPDVKKETEKFYKELEKIGREAGEKAKAFIDSLLREIEKEDLEGDELKKE